MPNPLLALPDEISGYSLGIVQSNYAVIKGEGTTNMILNPSFENATFNTGWTVGSGSWSASPAYATRGRVSASLAGTSGSIYTTVALTTGEPYTFSVDVRGRAGSTITLTAESSGQTTRTATARATGRWQRVTLTFVATATQNYNLRVAGNTIFVDGAQLENKPYATTYCDGDVRGFGIVANEYRWDTVAHASMSFRSASTRHGGQIIPLAAGGNVHIVADQGFGMAPQLVTVADLYDGSSFVSQSRDRARDIVLSLAIYGDSPRDLRKRRQDIIQLLAYSPSQVPQPMVLIVYPTNESDELDGEPLSLYCYYVEGMEGIRNTYYSERVAIRLRTTTPYFMEQYPDVAQFGTFASLGNVGQVMYRSPLGEWQVVTPNAAQYEVYNVGPPRSPANPVNAVDFLGETVVVGGGFENVEGVAAYDFLFSWNPTTGTKAAVGNGVNNEVTALARGLYDHRGKLFIGGQFTANLANSVTARRLAVHPGGLISTNLQFPAVGVANGEILCFAFHPNGNIYIAGSFLNLSSGSSTPDSFAKLNPSTYSAEVLGKLNTMSNGFWFAMTVGPDENVYLGGMDGTIIDGEAAGPVVRFNTQSGQLEGLGQRLKGNNVFGLEFGPDGYLYAVGEDFDLNSKPTSGTRFVARYNGFEWEVLNPASGGSPGGANFYDLEGARGLARIDNTLYITGGFRRPSVGYARFIGGRVVPGDIIIPNYGVWDVSASEGGALAFGLYAGDPGAGGNPWVQPSNMTAYPALTQAITVLEESEWDLIVVGPTTLVSLSNFTTNSHLFFAPYTVAAGEYVTISLVGNRIVGKSSRLELPIGNFLLYSDVPGRMALQPGTNQLQLAMSGYNSSTTKVSLAIRRKIRSIDYA